MQGNRVKTDPCRGPIVKAVIASSAYTHPARPDCPGRVFRPIGEPSFAPPPGHSVTPPTSIPLVIVAAIGRNGAIGRDNALPWSMPSDLAHFRESTMGRPMIMGRRTHESIGRVLPGRESIVVTRSTGLAAMRDPWIVETPQAALALARVRAAALNADAATLIGGASLFSSMMDVVDRLDLTIVDLAPEADTFFPPIDPALWREVARVTPPRGARDEAGCDFVTYVRRSGS